jgi:hypothetical protein
MTMDPRLRRRIAGVLRARLPELGLETLPDPRHRRGRRWTSLATLVRGCLVGLMAGRKSFRELESLTEEIASPMRRELGIPRRIPDTTLRTTLCKLSPDTLRECLRSQARAAHRRNALAPLGLPFGVVAIDGKYTAIKAWDPLYAQKQDHGAGLGASGVVRTMTCSLVSSRVTICLDAPSIPSATNEMGHFPKVLSQLDAAYGALKLFRMISADAGMCSESNARCVVEQFGLDYLFRLKGEQPTLYRDAKRLLGRRVPHRADATTVDIRGNVEVTRRLYLTSELAGYLGWDHLKTVLRVQVEKRDIRTAEVLEQKDDEKDRYYLSSLEQPALSPEKWLILVRRHWGIENDCHNTWDKIFLEDDHPWIVADRHGDAPRGAVVVMLLRRIAYNLLALFRSVTQRSDERRQTPWKDLIRWVYNVLVAVTENDLLGLRQRAGCVA